MVIIVVIIEIFRHSYPPIFVSFDHSTTDKVILHGGDCGWLVVLKLIIHEEKTKEITTLKEGGGTE